MDNIEKELRTVIEKLFKEKKINLVIGYTKGTLPLVSTPIFLKEEKDVDKLIFDVSCGNNLVKYLKRHRIVNMKDTKVAIIAKGCDGRAIVQYIAEGQIKRDDVLIIGVPCEGVVDPKKIRSKTNGKEVSQYRIEDKKIILKGNDFEISLNKSDVLSDSCLRCRYPNSPLYDIFITEPTKSVGTKDEYEKVNEFEKLTSSQRWQYFENEMSKCLRCYACRNACPMCYCEDCFVDQSNPQWFGKGTDLSDTIIFHIVRVIHTAGRCVDCGACARACPVNIELDLLNTKAGKEIQERFGYTPGLDPDETPAMAAYDAEDKQEFIL